MLKYKIIFIVATALCLSIPGCKMPPKELRPNIVLILLDDSGYADYPPFGDPVYSTPAIEQLAKEGCVYSNFYVPQAICSASRAVLLSGCYPGRTKVFAAHGPGGKGLDPEFPIISEVLQQNGYKTAVFGKWHIGDQPATRPYSRGFDESCGLMYSNDMWGYHPVNPDYWSQWPLSFWENDSIIIENITPEEQKMLTTWYTEYATDFIKRNKNNAFFIYLPHSMPHVPLYCSDKFSGKSGKGLYADVMQEIDWSVGEIIKAINENGLEENTIIILTSDNGPWKEYGNHAGKTPFREAKQTSFDGGLKSACIIKFPKMIKANSSSTQMFCSVDIFRTLTALAGVELGDIVTDGSDVSDIIEGREGAKNPGIYYPFSTMDRFEGIITADGKWKLHLPHEYKHVVQEGNDGIPGKFITRKIDLSLFDLESDPGESENVLHNYPQIADSLIKLANKHKALFYSDN